MAQLAYRSWGLIAVDAEPLTGVPSSARPPMLTSVAVDGGASLVFELASHGGDVAVRLEATALSAEGRKTDAFEVYTGSGESFSALPGASWEKTMEGMSGVFSCDLSGVASYVKLRSKAGDSLIVTAVQFTTP